MKLSFNILSGLLDLPKPVIVTISLSVFAVLMLAVFVYYMWRNQERSAEIAREVQSITNEIGAGVVEFIAHGDGYITYASKGFYKFIGYEYEELKELFDNGIYRMLEEKDAVNLKSKEIAIGTHIKEEVAMKTRQGTKWVIISGNAVQKKKIITISAVIVDITNEKLLNEKVALQRERYRLVTELSNDVIFDYDISDDIMNMSENYNTFYMGSTCIKDFLAGGHTNDPFVAPEDTEKFAELFRILVSMGDRVDEQLRIQNINGNYVWCRIIAMPVKDSYGMVKEVIGKIINIDLHKKELARLETKAMRDPLTGALNKEYTKIFIERYMEENPDKNGMLFVVDIDKFKEVNDTYGHIAGDNVIIEVIKAITKSFRSSDIVGRIGGDEFVVFACNVQKKEDQIKQAKKLQDVLRQPVEFNGRIIHKSASIGISMFPDHGSTYEELVECADKALYAVKGSGRDAFIMYDDSNERVKKDL
ncbi:MAG: sensor domain-containing diguanylate cyclase [Lachnospiraceae bacterium]|nr:sensor domain-containing diguanylate cyclase [Lachnospiraceae bacterium]